MYTLRIVLKGACLASALLLPLVAADIKSTSAVANGSVDSPSMGFAVRPDGSELRAILGVPGAARFSDPLPLPEGVTAAEMAPGQGWAFLIRSSDSLAFRPGSSLEGAALPGGVPSAWVFSPSGSRMALFFADRGEVALVSGLPLSPKLDRTLKIGAFDAAAVGDSGGFIYSVEGRLYDSKSQFVYESAGLGTYAFAAGRDAIVMFDNATASLVELDLTSTSTRVIAAGFGTPDRLFAASDKIYAGSSAAGTFWTIGYADGSVTEQSVPVSRITPSGFLGTMLVSLDSEGPSWLVNAQGVSFVPAVVKSAVE